MRYFRLLDDVNLAAKFRSFVARDKLAICHQCIWKGKRLLLVPNPVLCVVLRPDQPFLLADNDKIPSNIKSWLERGEVPPGYAAHHRKALFDGGTDTVDNMVLQGVDLHKITHRFYRPGGQVPSISPPPPNPY
jgi:hypothetical protein